MKFERGELLEFQGAQNYNAEKGAKAICVGYHTRNEIEYIDVKWIRNGDDNDQVDGGYFESQFRKSEDDFTQNEDRIFKENKKVMKFDLEKGKQRLVEYFQSDFERAVEYSIEYIKSCDSMDDIENEVASFHAFEKEHNKIKDRIERASTLSLIFLALDDTSMEDDDETILSFFIEELQ
jgi:ATP-dependent helicase YprA (DUF1998 family)